MRRVVLLFLLACLAVPGSVHAFDPFQAAGIDEKPGAAVPLDLAFTQADGTRTTLRAIADGRPILLAPVLHRCPNICGVTLSGLMQAVLAQTYRPGTDFALVAFGIAPEEGPDAAAGSLRELRLRFPRLPETGVHALTGTKSDIRAVTDALGYRYQWDERIGEYAHVAAVAALTPDGRLSRWLYGLAPTPDDVQLALTEAGEGTIGSLAEKLLLLCYHYDPETGRYSPLVWAALRLAGGLTVGAGGLALAIAFRRERRKARGAGR
ncbi:SCO family protein [Shinella sp.]|uniref:SCO family protein n=1 Tax=Shinella sp. TaxID=1870904 RepID=UPI00301E015E